MCGGISACAALNTPIFHSVSLLYTRFRYQVSGETGWFMLVWFVLWASSLFFVRRVTVLSRKDANLTVVEKRAATRSFAAAYAVVSIGCLAAVLGMLTGLLSDRQ